MPIDLKSLSGFLNTDDAPNILPGVHHRMAKNVRFRGNGNNYRVENVEGTNLIPNQYLPAGRNECIGSFFDSLRQRIFWFNWNSNDRHGIYQLNLKTKAITPLIINFTNSTSDILGFSLDFPIPSVVMLYTTEEDGDILHWVARNNRPMKLNIKDAEDNIYGANWKLLYLTVNRPTPSLPPICSYANDNTVTINNLRRKLYQFRYRFVYKDNNKSTWSSYGKLFAPANPDSLATDVDPTKNNRIDAILQTGDADVLRIEVSARQSIVTTFSDCFLVADLDKAELGISDNGIYIFSFFNDSSYPYVDIAENNLLWSVVPQVTNTMELLNGNVIVYGAATEGYNFDETLDVDKNISLIDNSGTISLSFITNPYLRHIDFNTEHPNVHVGNSTFFSGDMTLVVNVSLKSTYVLNPTTTFEYTSIYTYSGGDTIQDMVNWFRNDIRTNGGPNFEAYTNIDNNIANTISADTIAVTIYTGGSTSKFSTAITVTSSAIGSNDVNISMFHYLSKYNFGLVYFDEFDETDGVITDATLVIETPETDTTGDSQMMIPQITFSVNHQPPIWAVKFSWVVTNSLTYGAVTPTVSSDTDHDSDYGYFDITPQQTNQNGFPPYDFVQGDRVRIIGKYSDTVNLLDVPVVEVVEDPKINSVDKTGTWLKVPYDSTYMSSFGTGGFENYTLEIYTPALNTNPDLRVFYEFGQEFTVINPNTASRAHSGMTQDQIVGVQPAIFVFTRGDFYIRSRKQPLNDDLTGIVNFWIVDQSVSDQYPSKVKNNGRPYVIDKSAINTFYMTRLRWSEAYQQNTNINQTNIFYPLNLDEIDRSKGAIQRFKVRDRILRVFQNRGCGQFGIYARFIQNNNGNSTLVTTDDILTTNNINYYLGEYGMGDQYCGLVSGKNQDYFTDPVRCYDVRLSNDGLQPISEQNKGQFYIQPLFRPYNKDYQRPSGGFAKILGCYNFFEEEKITVLQGGSFDGNEILSYNFSFNEKRNAYCSFFENDPEWITCAEDILYGWKDGNIYSYDNTDKYCYFFGVQKYPSITLVFNDKEIITKKPLTIGYQSNVLWTAPNDGDVQTSFINPQTGLQQISKLKEFNFSTIEGKTVASLLRDINSGQDKLRAWHNGDYLLGFYTQLTLTYYGSDYAYLFAPFLKYALSNPNVLK